MPGLEDQIARWRRSMASERRIDPETLEELETHLRESLDRLMRSGIEESRAFQTAVDELGAGPMLGPEFEKLDSKTWFPVKIVMGSELLLSSRTWDCSRWECCRLNGGVPAEGSPLRSGATPEEAPALAADGEGAGAISA